MNYITYEVETPAQLYDWCTRNEAMAFLDGYSGPVKLWRLTREQGSDKLLSRVVVYERPAA